MVETVLVILFPLLGHGRPQLVSACGHPEHGSGYRLLARLGQRIVGFTFDVLPFLERYDGLPWMRRSYVKTVFLAPFSQEQACPNPRHVLLLLLSYE